MSEKLKVQVLEGADNKLDLAKLEDVLKRKLIIPSYQRPYAWQSEDIEEIFQTVSNARENNESICFFGSIILSKAKDKGYGQESYYIIDGQQRLSSFLLILRVFLDTLEELLKKLEKASGLNEGEIEKKLKLKEQKNKLSEIIKTVDLERDGRDNETEQSILNFIKKSGEYKLLSKDLKKIIDAIYKYEEQETDSRKNPLRKKEDWPEPENKQEFMSYVSDLLEFLDIVLNKIKFCLICITGENSEYFAINLFNTLNTTGQPLTAFEVLKSELYTIDQNLSNKINDIQHKIIEKYARQRKKIIVHTGKLLLYLPLYRGDFKEGKYTLSDQKFKDQRGYLKSVLNNNSAKSIVEDIEVIDKFYSDYWRNTDNLKNLLKKEDEQVCFQFLSDPKHDRVLPILIRFYKNNQESLGKCVKICAAFSSLWRAFSDGGASGIDTAYKGISLRLKSPEIEPLRQEMKSLFFKKISGQKSEQKIEEIKSKWLQKLKTSPIYKNQTLCKFLLFLAYNQTVFDSKTKNLKKGKGIDIFNTRCWSHEDYKTIEHIIPQSGKTIIGHVHTLGNLTLLPIALNSSLGNKPFTDKKKEYEQFCSTENADKYPYLPVIRHIASYNQFGKEQIEERSEILSALVWQKLAEGWLGWK